MANERGSASVDMVIVTTVIVVFVLLPLIAFATERLVIHYSINVVVEAMEASIFSMTTSLDMDALSEAEIAYDEALIQIKFREVIEEKLNDLVEIEIVELSYYPVEAIQMPCQAEGPLIHDTLHARFNVWYEHKLYRHLIGNGQRKKVQFHYDLELPQNR